MPVDREQLMEEIMPSLYGSDPASKADGRELAVAFAVFACGSAADRTQPQDNDEGRIFYHLSRSALGMNCMVEDISLSTVQALTLMAVYTALCGRKGGVEASWRWTSIAAHAAAGVSDNI